MHPQLAWNRGWLNLLRTRGDRLDSEQRQQLAVLLRRQPALEPIYQLKEQLCTLLCHRSQTKVQCQRLVAERLAFIDTLRTSGLELAKKPSPKPSATGAKRSRALWRFAKNNGITEGFHRKTKLIQCG